MVVVMVTRTSPSSLVTTSYQTKTGDVVTELRINHLVQRASNEIEEIILLGWLLHV